MFPKWSQRSAKQHEKPIWLGCQPRPERSPAIHDLANGHHILPNDSNWINSPGLSDDGTASPQVAWSSFPSESRPNFAGRRLSHNHHDPPHPQQVHRGYAPSAHQQEPQGPIRLLLSTFGPEQWLQYRIRIYQLRRPRFYRTLLPRLGQPVVGDVQLGEDLLDYIRTYPGQAQPRRQCEQAGRYAQDQACDPNSAPVQGLRRKPALRTATESQKALQSTSQCHQRVWVHKQWQPKRPAAVAAIRQTTNIPLRFYLLRPQILRQTNQKPSRKERDTP